MSSSSMRLVVIFSDGATVQLESHRKRGGTNGTERIGRCNTIAQQRERSKTETFLTHTVLPSTATFRLQFCPSSVQPYSILCV